jgi:hypothetical protein
MGVTNCVASICGFLAPYIVNLIVTESVIASTFITNMLFRNLFWILNNFWWLLQGSLDQWQTVFFLSAGIYAATNLFYVVFSTGVEQPWNKINRDPILEQRRNESISSMTSSSSSDQSSKSKWYPRFQQISLIAFDSFTSLTLKNEKKKIWINKSIDVLPNDIDIFVWINLIQSLLFPYIPLFSFSFPPILFFSRFV